jgi:hypothetical protein
MRTAARIALPVGAAGSLGFMLFAGRHNSSRLLLVIFALWVLSPYAALAWATTVSGPRPVRTSLYGLILVIAIVSLAIYGYVALGPPGTKAAPVFVVIPPVSWLLFAIWLAFRPR